MLSSLKAPRSPTRKPGTARQVLRDCLARTTRSGNRSNLEAKHDAGKESSSGDPSRVTAKGFTFLPAGVRTEKSESALRPRLATNERRPISPSHASADHVGSFHLLWRAFSRTVAEIFSNSDNLQPRSRQIFETLISRRLLQHAPTAFADPRRRLDSVSTSTDLCGGAGNGHPYRDDYSHNQLGLGPKA